MPRAENAQQTVVCDGSTRAFSLFGGYTLCSGDCKFGSCIAEIIPTRSNTIPFLTGEAACKPLCLLHRHFEKLRFFSVFFERADKLCQSINILAHQQQAQVCATGENAGMMSSYQVLYLRG